MDEQRVDFELCLCIVLALWPSSPITFSTTDDQPHCANGQGSGIITIEK